MNHPIETPPRTTGVQLTTREREILGLVSYGHRSKEAADLLCVSKRTVDFHLRNIFQKLDVNNRMSAVRVAARRGLI